MAMIHGTVSGWKTFIRCSSDRGIGAPGIVRIKRRDLFTAGSFCVIYQIHHQNAAVAVAIERPQFYELHGVKVLDIRQGSGEHPKSGDKVAIHYYGRLAAKQGWRFDTTYDHKDEFGNPEPFIFTIDSNNVIAGLNSAVKTMKPGGTRRVIIPPSQGYQSTAQEPLPPNIFDRQRLFTTIFNPTRAANGESSTLGTLVFDIQLLNIFYTE